MRAFGFNACCCNDCDERCPDDGYCTACGEAADEAATYEVVLSGFGSVDLTGSSGFGAVCDLSVINGTYALPYVGVGAVCIGIGGGCQYYLYHNLGVNAFACNPTDIDHHLMLILELSYTADGNCVCGSCVHLLLGIDSGSHGIAWQFTTVDADLNRVIPCGDTLTFTVPTIAGTAAVTKL